MEFTIEELPKTTQGKQFAKKVTGFSRIKQIIQDVFIRFSSVIRKCLNRLSFRGELLVMLGIVLLVSALVIVIDEISDNRLAVKREVSQQYIRELALQNRQLEAEILPVKNYLEQAGLQRLGNTLPALEALLLDIATQLPDELYFTALQKHRGIDEWELIGVAEDFNTLIRLESLLEKTPGWHYLLELDQGNGLVESFSLKLYLA